MTLTTLAAILVCLCGDKGTFADKQECADPYLNCAVMNDGHVMTKPQFFDKCLKDVKLVNKCANAR